ncbi:ABC transporter ATP-binding protein [Shinella sp.]|uniref:ABC transporter ATP-binding protein n=1 Tax=Shinella sp. TaxID=1870904 RepID=UPI003F6EC036
MDRINYLASLRLLARHSAGARVGLLLSVGVVSSGLELLPLWLVWRLVVSIVEGTATFSGFLLTAGMTASVILLGYAAQVISIAGAHRAAFRMIHTLRLAVALRLARFPLGRLSRLSAGEAKALIVDEPDRLETVIAHGLPEGAGALVTWFVVSLWLFAVDWRMAFAAVVLTPIAFFAIGLGMARSGREVPAFQKANERMNAAIVEFLAGMPVVKVFGGAGFSGVDDAVRAYLRIETAIARDHVVFLGIFNALVLANITIILPAGLWLMSTGTLDVETFLLFVIVGAGYSQPLVQLFVLFQAIAKISVSSTAVASVLDSPVQSDTGCRVLLPNRDIVFDKVCFAYGDRTVLHDISFAARQGTVTALVGASGSGKSTVASLVARFDDVSAGRITLGGVDPREIAVEQLMEEVSVVFQDVFLFADTIAANIALGKPGATLEEIRAAARAAQADAFITALPDGYETQLATGGGTLSGGERQRIAIARAMLKASAVVVLDEATAFADAGSEAAIQQAIGALAAGRTLLVIAHRLHTIAAADQIVVLSGGRVFERGDHASLLGRKDAYARLWADWTAARSMTLRSAVEKDAPVDA